MRSFFFPYVCFAVAFFPLAAMSADNAPLSSEQIQLFENRIRPILVNRCYECHSKEMGESEGGLTLDTKAGWTLGGDSGPAIVPGRADSSPTINAVGYENVDLQMPPDGKLSAQEIADLTKWVEMGAPDPRTEPSTDAAPNAESEFETRRRDHWAWQPLGTSRPPNTRDKGWPRCDADRYILQRLEQAGLSPAPAAAKRIYIRRVTFDLTGLPPAPEEIEVFLADDSADAFPTLVDRLLDSPHFGEHWAQHWLDLVRYAETRGHEQDFPIPEAYRYRDYVIRALNQDVPYNQLVAEHVAGDLLGNPRLDPVDHSNQSIQGTGFWHLGEATHSPVDIRGDEADRVHNQIDVFSRAFLGLSVGCARCHDHKFDPISARDYYALFGYLQSSSYQLADVSDPERQQKAADELTKLKAQHLPSIAEAFVALKRHQLGRLPAYLLATCDSARNRQSFSAEGSSGSVKIADERALEPETLERVRDHLKRAASDTHDPLHVFARASKLDGPLTDEHLDRLKREWKTQLQDAARATRQQWESLTVVCSVKTSEGKYTRHERAWSEEDVIEDFSCADPGRWMTSGRRFGPGPIGPGQVLLGDSLEWPMKRFAIESVADSTEPSSKFTGILRTRTFEVTGDTLWYRYRGKADVFLVVDSHRVVQGPLHGVVKLKLDCAPDQWQWKSHLTRDYVGHRVHVEFTPGEEFALERILFASKEPPLELPEPEANLDPLVTPWETVNTPASLAEVCRDQLAHAVNRLAKGQVTGHDARLLNWLLEHDALFESVETWQHRLEGQLARYLDDRSKVEARIPGPVRALALLDGSGEDEPVHIRGNHRNLSADRVPRAILAALSSRDPASCAHGSGRLQLAQALVQSSNPLVPRVFVNRIWHHLFGRGIVATVDDFGAMGIVPTHPELLDYLVRRLIENGWSMKQMIREIVLSSTYRMSSHGHAENDRIDPADLLLHRTLVRRLSAESIRDHMLVVSGQLDRQLYGESVKVHITAFMRGNRSPKGSGPLDGAGRRSIYTEVRRNHLPAMLVAFDRPVPFTALGRRNISNSPAQPLILLNNPFVYQQAEHWASRTLRAGEDDEMRLRDAYVRGFGRYPSATEIEAARAFLETQATEYQALGEPDSRKRAWIDLCHTLMNVKEFIYIN